MLDLARDYLRRAEARLMAAETSLSRGDYPEAVRYSQECVEMSLKASLRAMGIEYPKVHEVGRVLLIEGYRFPAWFREHIEQLAEISRDLAEKRAPSMYGVEAAGKPAGELFNKEDAEEAVRNAKYVHEHARRLVEEIMRKTEG